MQTPDPIFVVGVQRSGTTLLAATLAAHGRMSCGPETHFFRVLSRLDAARLLDPAAWPLAAVEFLSSIKRMGARPDIRTRLLDLYGLDRGRVAGYLRDRRPSIAAVLGAVTEQYMAAKGKSRWVEKTPDHLLHLAAIREHFPRSPIIRIVRDPRDVALSLTNVPWGVRSPLEGLLYWMRLDRASRDFFIADRLSYTLRFEDLLLSPAAELQKLSDFIGEEFEERMLDTSASGNDVNSQDVPWKKKASERLDVGRVAVWRTGLSREENRLAEAILGDQLEAWGYARRETSDRFGRIYPGIEAARPFAPALKTVAGDGVRFWRRVPEEKAQASVYLGDPSGWLGRGKARRAIRALPILKDVVRATVSDGRVYWVPEAGGRRRRGWLAFMLRMVLAAHRVAYEPAGPQAAGVHHS